MNNPWNNFINSRDAKSGMGTKFVNNNVQVPTVFIKGSKKLSLLSEIFINFSINELLSY